MISVRRSKERGHFENDWLNSYHTFSFGEYHDPKHMGVSVLRVINDDRIIAGAGFPTHPHNNMEIVTYVLEGELAHKDSMGNGSTMRPGDVQRMSAGSGVTHSEFNPSTSEGTHLLQIWLLPSQRDIPPSYEQKYFSPAEKHNQFTLLVSPDGREGSIQATTDTLLYGSVLSGEQHLEYDLEPTRTSYIHVAKGSVVVNGNTLTAGDGATLNDVPSIHLDAEGRAEVLLFDLPK